MLHARSAWLADQQASLPAPTWWGSGCHAVRGGEGTCRETALLETSQVGACEERRESHSKPGFFGSTVRSVTPFFSENKKGRIVFKQTKSPFRA